MALHLQEPTQLTRDVIAADERHLASLYLDRYKLEFGRSEDPDATRTHV